MRALPVLLASAVLLAGCSKEQARLPGLGLREEIEFRYAPSFSPEWVVHLERNSHGDTSGEIYRRWADDETRDHSRALTISTAAFERLIAQIESPEFKDAAELDPRIGQDSVRYLFRHYMGNRILMIDVWNPEPTSTAPVAKMALQIARDFLAVAGIKGVSELESAPLPPKRRLQSMPNNSPDPKLPPVTPAAEPAVAPAGRSAH